MTTNTPGKELKDAAYGRAFPAGFPDDAPRSRRRAFDPIIIAALVISVGFVLIAIVYPVGSVIREALSPDAIPVFERYLTTVQNRIFVNTMVLGLAVSAPAARGGPGPDGRGREAPTGVVDGGRGMPPVWQQAMFSGLLVLVCLASLAFPAPSANTGTRLLQAGLDR